MSKTNDTSNGAAATSERELTEKELNAVTGGENGLNAVTGGNEVQLRKLPGKTLPATVVL
jgi:bacteriocin-like protein